MDLKEFTKQIKEDIPVGTVFENPGGGTSEIVSYSDNSISYVRGSSAIYVSFRDLFDAYENYRGKRVTSSDLKSYAPAVFDATAKKSGHSCNCTLFFLILKRLNLADEIKGRGVKGDPYFVEIDEGT